MSIKMDAHRAILNGENKINLKKARHPLINPEIVVPINLSL